MEFVGFNSIYASTQEGVSLESTKVPVGIGIESYLKETCLAADTYRELQLNLHRHILCASSLSLRGYWSRLRQISLLPTKTGRTFHTSRTSIFLVSPAFLVKLAENDNHNALNIPIIGNRIARALVA